MMTLAAALLLAMVPQDEARLKEAWPKLVDAWKAVDAYKPSPEAGALDDEFIKVAAKLNGAFEAAGLFATEGEYLPRAVKAIIKIKGRSLVPGVQGKYAGQILIRRMRVGAGGAFEATVEDDPLSALVASLKKLQALKQEGLDDEENVQDELVTARKSLKALGITADETPPGLRRRALHLVKAIAFGEAYPDPPKATEEQAKEYRAWITELGNESIETREKATKELLRAGETTLPFVRDALKSPDAEIATRARQLLGVGHAPWTKVKPPDGDMTWTIDLPVAVPAAPAPAPAPQKEEKPK